MRLGFDGVQSSQFLALGRKLLISHPPGPVIIKQPQHWEGCISILPGMCLFVAWLPHWDLLAQCCFLTPATLLYRSSYCKAFKCPSSSAWETVPQGPAHFIIGTHQPLTLSFPSQVLAA